MLQKSMIAGAAMAAALLVFQAAPTQADGVNIIISPNGFGIGIGNGGGGNVGRRDTRVTCRQARRTLRNNGFHDISTIDCQGDSYKFNAWRHGSKWRVKLNAWSGEVTSVRQI